MDNDKLSKKQVKLLNLVFNNENEQTIEHFLQKHFKKQQCNGVLSRSNSLSFRFLDNCYIEYSPDSNVVCSLLIQYGKFNILSKLYNTYSYLPRKLTLDLDIFSLKNDEQYNAYRMWLKMCISSIKLIPDEVILPSNDYLKDLRHFISINSEGPHSIISQYYIWKFFRQYMKALFCHNFINDESLITDYLLFVKEHCEEQDFCNELNIVSFFNSAFRHSVYCRWLKNLLADNNQPNVCSQSKSKSFSLKIEEHNECEQEHFDFKTP